MNFIFNVNCLIATIFLLHQGFTDFADRPCQHATQEYLMFIDLDDFNKSKATFIKGEDGFEANRLIFVKLTNRELEKKSFICETCEFIVDLLLRGDNLVKIEDGAFEKLRCLKNLDLSVNNLTVITPETFADLQNLETLAIQKNKLRVLKNNTFAKNRHLKELDLIFNEIYYIEKLAFYNLSLLERLLLDNNKMVIVNFEIFRNLPKLKYLYLAKNLITSIEPSKSPFSNTIESIDVSYNQLTEGVEYIYLPNIIKIKFTHNRLYKLDVEALKSNCPKLEYIEIFDNFWECKELSNIKDSLQKVNIRYGEPIKCIQKFKGDAPFQSVLLTFGEILFFVIMGIGICVGYLVKPRRNRIPEEIELEGMQRNEPMAEDLEHESHL